MICWNFVELVFPGHDRPVMISARALLSSFSMAVTIILIERRPGFWKFCCVSQRLIHGQFKQSISPLSKGSISRCDDAHERDRISVKH